MKKDIRTLAALLIASAAFVACSNSDDFIIEDQQPASGKYTMTINASKGDGATTRALTIGRNAEDTKNVLNATWATSENVYVQKGSTWATGSLQPQTDDATATLKGTLSGVTIAAGDDLTLQFPRSGARDYTGQVGTLADISSKYDYATATVKVASISPTGNINPEAATTTFTNQQAIVKFTLKNKATDAALSATQLVVNDGTNSYTVTPASATSEIYVAIPGFSGQTVTLTATDGSYNYTFSQSGVTFTNGQYYEITVKMNQMITTYTAPTLRTGLTFNGNSSNVSGSAQNLVNAGTVTHGTIYYSTNGGSSWSTSLPTGTNAGSYTVHYKVVPDAGYSGGIGSTSLGSTTIAKANGWCTLSSTSSTGWMSSGKKSVTITVSHHGGTLSPSKSGLNMDNIDVSISGSSVTISKKSGKIGSGTVTITSAATANYNAASATYSCKASS